MLDDDTTVDTTPESTTEPAAQAPAAKKAAAKKAPAKKAAAKKAPAKKAAAKKAPAKTADPKTEAIAPDTEAAAQAAGPVKKSAAKRAPAKKAGAKAEPTSQQTQEAPAGATGAGTMLLFKAPEPVPGEAARSTGRSTSKQTSKQTGEQAGEQTSERAGEPAGAERQAKAPAKKTAAKKTAAKKSATREDESADGSSDEPTDAGDGEGPDDETAEGAARRRRRRGGRRRRKPGGGDGDDDGADDQSDDDAQGARDGEEGGDGPSTRRRRVRARAGESRGGSSDDPSNTVTRVRQGRSADDEIAGFTGSTRLEAKKQRRREGREAGRRRAPIISEAEFLARREAVDRVMVIRQRKDLTQIAVLEDKVLVEHYVARESQTSLIGNVYLGRVQNVLPSMEAAFIDIGKGRNAVLYAGEVNWDALGAKDGSQRKIEAVLKSGQSILVQVSKDPMGHKGARLTSQISLPGRFLVYVPDGTTSGISRKLPDTERNRLKTLLKEIVPETAGVIVRTAAEGASEDELTRDVERLKARWVEIEKQVEGGNAPQLLYGEPDLTLKVVRDLFTEDFAKLVISGDEAWETVSAYVENIAPDLAERVERHEDGDAFSAYRIDEQIAKGLDRKVWLPSGGSLIIDRTEAMTVVDVNTGKFTGSGGNLEETVTKNNLEAAEEMVRQLRLRDIGGIIVVDFIDMVLESNRDLVLRRLVECLGRDRTRHQVAEVTSLGLVQMTRKRIGTGLLEAFSENCDHCQGRGLITHHEPVEQKKKSDEEPRRSRRNRGRGKGGSDEAPAPGDNGRSPRPPSPAVIAAMARHEDSSETEQLDGDSVETPSEETRPADLPAESFEPESREPESTPEAESREPESTREAESREPESTPEAEVTREPESTREAESREPESTPEAEVTREPEPAAEPVVQAAPKVVTSVRRVSARRAAGPPKPVETGSQTQTLDIPELEEHDSAAPAHVPIKKKGARKR